ncbi:hypothetical protein M427DRAFT_394316 [Gonapodya prolifera JEL478]|uniref:Uncharacterized protein n=1 Tax=Gonapodya prolifera (strain JEL478) TaxID=1344416 RepID=A0A139A6Y9_GONPJ|nr:hypothetical protein M427DRAFT_394316 [Gonapodya prolifera JEL478]|eukprot:KXS12474.1 hypothetical protein M427DRAFT_394316 [Gonapodya prolifera JEL478]
METTLQQRPPRVSWHRLQTIPADSTVNAANDRYLVIRNDGTIVDMGTTNPAGTLAPGDFIVVTQGTELREHAQPEEFLPSYQVVVPGGTVPETEGSSSAHPDPISHESGTPAQVALAPSPPSLVAPPDAALSRPGPAPIEHMPEPSAPVLSTSLPSIPPPAYDEVNPSPGR